MSNDGFQNFKISELGTQNRFPIVMQLSILAFVLVGIFSVAFFRLEPEVAPATQAQQNQNPGQAQGTKPVYDSGPQKITEEVAVTARAAYVWDVAAQRVLYSKEPDTVLPLASITKLMTALVAHELLSEEELTAVPISAIRQEGSSGLSAGEEFNFASLQRLALISSSNDAAYTMAASVGGLLGDRDPMWQFVESMNIRAEELGLHSLHFSNPTGLDVSAIEPGAVGSARDVTFLLEEIITEYPEIIASTQEQRTRVYNTAGEYHEVENTNPLVIEIPGLIASKTGYTDLAGGNLVVAYDFGYNRPIIVTVLGSTYNERFDDVLHLVDAVRASVTKTE